MTAMHILRTLAIVLGTALVPAAAASAQRTGYHIARRIPRRR